MPGKNTLFIFVMEKMMYMKKLEYSAPLKKFSLIASFMLVAAIFVACGDDESFAVRPGEDEAAGWGYRKRA